MSGSVGRAIIRASLIGLSAGIVVAPAHAAEIYPAHTITVVVPFAPGGATDVLPRMLSEALRARLGQPIVIENIAGAGGTIGLGRVARAPADGYTLVSGNWSTFVANGAIYTLPYDLVRDFAPVVLLPSNSHVIAGRRTLPAGDLRELVSWLKTNQDKVSMATAGVGTASHLAAVLLQNLTGTRFPLAHYRGGGPALQDLLSGQVDLMTNQAAVLLPQGRAGNIRLYAALAKERLPQATDIPTAEEAGLPNFEMSVWNGFWAPRGTPDDVITRLNGAVVESLAAPALRQRLLDLAYEMQPREQLTPMALGALQRSEIEKWWPIIRAANVKAE